MGQSQDAPVIVAQGEERDIIVILQPRRGGDDEPLLAKCNSVLRQVMLNRRGPRLMGTDMKKDGANVATPIGSSSLARTRRLGDGALTAGRPSSDRPARHAFGGAPASRKSSNWRTASSIESLAVSMRTSGFSGGS